MTTQGTVKKWSPNRFLCLREMYILFQYFVSVFETHVHELRHSVHEYQEFITGHLADVEFFCVLLTFFKTKQVTCQFQLY